jgi:hypothetical protein
VRETRGGPPIEDENANEEYGPDEPDDVELVPEVLPEQGDEFIDFEDNPDDWDEPQP